MSETTSGSPSPESIALELLRMVMDAEKMKSNDEQGRQNYKLADRKYLLDTFAECMLAVRRPIDRSA